MDGTEGQAWRAIPRRLSPSARPPTSGCGRTSSSAGCRRGNGCGSKRLRRGYGVGIGTLREILSRLSAEGLVVAEGQRGFEVPPLSGRELEELAALRLLLERHALAESFAAGDVEWEGRVVAAHHKLEVVEGRMIAGRRDEAPAWKRYDSEFHQALISACGSRTLMQAHASGFDRYLRYLMVAACFRGAAAADEHRRLRDCALERDAEGAARVLEGHIRRLRRPRARQDALSGTPRSTIRTFPDYPELRIGAHLRVRVHPSRPYGLGSRRLVTVAYCVPQKYHFT